MTPRKTCSLIALALLTQASATVALDGRSANYVAPPGVFSGGQQRSASAIYTHVGITGYGMAAGTSQSGAYRNRGSDSVASAGAGSDQAVSTTSTTSSTTAATTSTTIVSTTTTTLGISTVAIAKGWNLIGNGSTTPIDVAATFADATIFTTVWKWIAAQNTWAFHSPSLAGTALTDYKRNYPNGLLR